MRRCAFLGFADDQVHVFRHYHVAQQLESVPRAHLPEYLHKTITRTSRAQVRPAAITTKRDEVQIAASVMPLQRIAHGRNAGPRKSQNPHPYKPKGAAPTVTSAAYKGPCVNDILAQWPMNQENSLRHPPRDTSGDQSKTQSTPVGDRRNGTTSNPVR